MRNVVESLPAKLAAIRVCAKAARCEGEGEGKAMTSRTRKDAHMDLCGREALDEDSPPDHCDCADIKTEICPTDCQPGVTQRQADIPSPLLDRPGTAPTGARNADCPPPWIGAENKLMSDETLA